MQYVRKATTDGVIRSLEVTVNPQSLNSKAINVLVPLLIVISLMLLIEVFARYWLVSTGQGSYPLVYRQPKSLSTNHVIRGLTVKANMLDPQLGYSYVGNSSAAHAYPGFVAYNKVLDGETGESSPLEIVALGGSTTDAQMDPDGNWPKLLGEILGRKGVSNVVFNGGIIGYSSNHETLKLLRDVLPLEPDWVISFNGINDLINNDKTPMVTDYQTLMMSKLLGREYSYFPNTVGLLTKILNKNSLVGINEGVEQNPKNVTQWERNIRSMHALSKEFGIRYIVFLQPTLGTGSYTMESYDKHLFSIMLRTRPDYPEELKAFYSEARLVCGKYDFCIDVVDIFAGAKRMYADVRHPNSRGNRKIADRIAGYLETRSMSDYGASTEGAD